MGLISIILPVYNAEDYIKRCLDSVINQTYKNLEIIIINDGSSDNSATILDEYAEKDSRIRVKHKKNKGVSAARNDALNMVTGDYIGFLDSDDWIDKDYFKFMYDSMKKYQCDVVVSGYISEFHNGRRIKSTDVVHTIEFNNTESIKTILNGQIFGGHLWNKLYKSFMFKDLRFQEDVYMYEDLLLNVELFLKANKVVFIPGFKYHYFRYPDSAVNKKVDTKYLTVLDASRRINEIIKDNCIEAIDFAQASEIRINLNIILKVIDNGSFEENIINNIRSNLVKLIAENKNNNQINEKQKIALFIIVHHFHLFKYLYLYIGKPYVNLKKYLVEKRTDFN